MCGENYRDVLRDCGKVLMRDEKNVKALYRSARACLATDKLDEADDAITRAMNLDASNSTFQNLKLEIAKQKGIIDTRNQKTMETAAKKRQVERNLQSALKVLTTIMTILTQTREIIVKTTSHPPDLGPIQQYHFSDPANPQSDLCFPTILLYPLSSQTDLIAEFPLSSTLNEQLSIVLEESPAWDVNHEYTVDKVDCFMEIEKETGLGLIKIRKSTPLEKAVKSRAIHDGIIRIFILPQNQSQLWITQWKNQNKPT